MLVREVGGKGDVCWLVDVIGNDWKLPNGGIAANGWNWLAINGLKVAGLPVCDDIWG